MLLIALVIFLCGIHDVNYVVRLVLAIVYFKLFDSIVLICLSFLIILLHERSGAVLTLNLGILHVTPVFFEVNAFFFK